MTAKASGRKARARPFPFDKQQSVENRPNNSASRVRPVLKNRASQWVASSASARISRSTIAAVVNSTIAGITQKTPVRMAAIADVLNDRMNRWRRHAAHALTSARNANVAACGGQPSNINAATAVEKSGGHIPGAIFG